MNNKQRVSPYLCKVIGESQERATRFHISTIRRTEAFAIAIHIPVLVWAVTGYLIATGVFALSASTSAMVAFGCASIVYLVERLVLATPRSFIVSVVRFVIGCVIALLGASAVDLVIFEREIEKQLIVSKRLEIESEHQKKVVAQAELTEQRRSDWQRAQEKANCEANGTCGSRIRSTGPVYRELARHADFLQAEYVAASAQLNLLRATKDRALAAFDAAPPSSIDAGLLTRVKALHDYTTSSSIAQAAWAVFFLLVLSFELMVVFCKMVFDETVDDEIEKIRENISQEKARSYRDAVVNPQAGAIALIDASYN
ncbi:Protein of unknown function DUF4407 [Burkholderiales bacterium]